MITLDNKYGRTELLVPCRACLGTVAVSVLASEYERFLDGELIQSAFSGLTPGEREIIISGVCEPCFDAMFKEEGE